jgi:uncharacterized protein (DUF433 family)
MPAAQKSLRIPEDILKEIKEIAKDSKKDFTAVTNELLKEAIKTHRCPGIVFTEGTRGKRARVAGTGIEVWEVIATCKSVDNDLKRLAKAYDWLTLQQLRSALGYYKLYPEEINMLITENEDWTPDKTKEKYPFLSAE